MPINPQQNFRLSEQARALMDKLRAKLGLKPTAIVELAIRRLAEREGIKPDDDKR